MKKLLSTIAIFFDHVSVFMKTFFIMIAIVIMFFITDMIIPLMNMQSTFFNLLGLVLIVSLISFYISIIISIIKFYINKYKN
jgi:hypothetical protein